jgi:hypothetical protein
MVAHGWLLPSVCLARVANDGSPIKAASFQRNACTGGHLLERDFLRSGCNKDLRRRDSGGRKVLNR